MNIYSGIYSRIIIFFTILFFFSPPLAISKEEPAILSNER